MKILLIRGRNLASLGGDFLVDFRAEPLQSTGLFAITGPTGAGKSTLLDALCLALYNRTPRLARLSNRNEAQLTDVGEHTLKTHDVRNLLRRGAIEGFAEVEFEGVDGHEYRARWSVRRARQSLTGALQDENVGLWMMPDLTPVGHKKTEVLAAIQQRVGLSFEEFSRAVLLAQNEFFAFLKADDSERAGLLEALTGSEIFSALSRAAFQRAKDELAALERLQQRLGDLAPLPEDARSDLEHALAAALSEETRAQATLDAARARRHWREQTVQLEQRLAAAEQEKARAEAALIEARPRRQRVDDIEAVQILREPVRLVDDLSARQQELDRAIADCLPAVRDAEAAETAAREALAASQSRWEACAAELARRQPDLDKARTLEVSIEEAGRVLHQASERVAQERQALAALPFNQLPGWENLRPLLGRAQDQDDLAAAADAGQRVEKLCAERRQHWEQADASDRAIDRSTQPARQLALQTENRRLEQAHSLFTLWRDSVQQAEALASEQERVNVDLARLAADLGRIRHELPIAKAAMDQAQHAVEQARLTCGEEAERLRTRLRPDTACPVCGSLEHPYAAGTPSALHDLLTRLESEAARQQIVFDGLIRQQHTFDAEAKVAADRLQTLSRQQEHLAALRRERSAQLDDLLADSGWRDVGLLDRPGWLTAKQASLTHAMQALQSELAASEASRLQLDAAGKQLRAAEAAQRCVEAIVTRVKASHTLNNLQREHEGLLAGERAAAVQDRLLHQQRSAEQARDNDRRRAEAAALNVARTREALAQQRHARDTVTPRLAQARTALDRAFADFQPDRARLNEAEVRERLRYDEAWRRRENLALQSLEQALDRCAHLLDSTRQALETHRQHPPVTGLEDIDGVNDPAQEISIGEGRLRELREAIGKFKLQITQDDQRRADSRTLAAECAEQEQTAQVWQRLSQVIGSGDGKKFRNAAQEITLDALLLHANAHLTDLARRYRLQRIPHTLGLQVIDRDMGDEVRSVHSLSGGESFLASLALALGLASLSSQRLKVESLFIDEGFGSLDADTLRVAMDALDILQGQGRKVGVISHVAEMTERIPVQIRVCKQTGGRSRVDVLRI